jgi:hypothetical protein
MIEHKYSKRRTETIRVKVDKLDIDADEDAESSAVYAYTPDGVYVHEFGCGHHHESAKFLYDAINARGSIEPHAGWRKM